VVQLQGACLTPEEIARRYPNGDNEIHGVFLKDPSLKAFNTARPAAGSLLRILQGFMVENSLKQCEQILDHYVTGGGDGGLTCATIRHACGLSPVIPPRSTMRLSHVPMPAGVLPSQSLPQARQPAMGGEDSQPVQGTAGCRTQPTDFYDGLISEMSARLYTGETGLEPQTWLADELHVLAAQHLLLVTHCLTQGTDLINRASVPRLTAGIWGEAQAKKRGATFDKLINYGFWRSLTKRGQIAEPCFPVLLTRRSLREVMLMVPRDKDLKLQEMVQFDRALSYVYGAGHAENNNLFLDYFRSMQHAPTGQRSRGKLTKEVQQLSNHWKDLYDNLSQHVHAVALLVESCRHHSDAQQMSLSPPDDHGTMHYNVEYAYKHYESGLPVGRRYARGLSFQSMSRRCRQAVAPAGLIDWDISNSMFVLFTQLVQRLELICPLPHACLPVWNRYASSTQDFRGVVSAAVGQDGKALIMEVANGKAMPEVSDADVRDFLTGVSQEGRLLRWLSCSLLPECHAKFIAADRKWPESSVMHYVWASVEDQCLLSWQQYTMSKSVKHLSLHYDGVMLDGDRSSMEDAYVDSSCLFIKNNTGFAVNIVQKVYNTFMQEVIARAHATAIVDVPDQTITPLLADGHSIALALGHLTGQYQRVRSALQEVDPIAVPIYKTWCDILMRAGDGTNFCGWRSLHPQHGLQTLLNSKMLLHAEGLSAGSCFAVDITGPDTVVFFAGRTRYSIQRDAFYTAYENCVDRHSLTTFTLSAGPSIATTAGMLCNLQAVGPCV
jgi:hypothetical protein